MQDIGGGLTTTVPAYRDWKNPDIQPYIEKYLAAKDGVSTEDRIRSLRLIKDMTGNHWQIDTIHGEGSMAAQEMFLYTSADWKRFQSAAKRAARINGWQDHPVYGKLPVRTDFVKMPAIDTSYESIALTAKK